MYVLDERMKPLPLGVPGRLYVSGVGLARGYLHKPQLTAEAFIANPFFDPFLDPPAFSRLFDTQVLSRWLPGGTLDFVGHAHRQVGPSPHAQPSLLGCHTQLEVLVLLKLSISVDCSSVAPYSIA